MEEGFVLDVLDVQGGTVGMPRARVVVSRDGHKSEATAEGDGMIDATCKAIKQATGIEAKLTDFNVSSVTGGIDALGDVVIQLDSEGVRASGRGLSTDVVEAAARAYVAATNRARAVQGPDRPRPGRGPPGRVDAVEARREPPGQRRLERDRLSGARLGSHPGRRAS